MKARALFLVLALAELACGSPSRFALRPPVTREADRPFWPPPKKDEESDYANTLDAVLLRPTSHAFLFATSGEAHDVSSLDEVPDSSWFTNRRPTVEEVTRGPCASEPPVLPLTIRSSKATGTTNGFFVVDARGRKYLLKLDDLGPRQPEISTASDAIASRFYWALGYNAPCNEVRYFEEDDFRLAPNAKQQLPSGLDRPLTRARMLAILHEATRGRDGTFRLSTSEFIAGKPVGTWRTEGTRKDDPNDVIPHEDRRELRGERLLAAWVDHWDSRGPNSFDAFVATRGREGYVRHYFLDFSDSLGGMPIRTKWPEPRMGFETVTDSVAIAEDLVTFGFLRRPWDEVKIDRRYPNLGYLDVAHFEPLRFAPQTYLERWARADYSDLGWMARKIARIDLAHVRAMVDAGKLSNDAERERLIEVLMGRRWKILRETFDRSSPLGEITLNDDRLCSSDLAIVSGVARPRVTYVASFVTAGRPLSAALEPVRGARVCVRLPPHWAERAWPADSAMRYGMLEIDREDGFARTRLRAYVYDLDSRGWFLAGVERL